MGTVPENNSLNAATLQWLHDLTDQGILTTDVALCIQGWNRWLETRSGYRAADVIGRPLMEVYPELARRRHDLSYQQALTGQVVMLSQRLHRYLLPMQPTLSQSGFEYMQQSAQIAPLISDGVIIGTITVIEDVTEREVRERELQRQITILEGLHEVSRAILSLDLPRYLQHLVETTASIIRVPVVAAVLSREDGLEIAAYTSRAGHLDPERVDVQTSVAVAAVSDGRTPLYIADMALQGTLTSLDPTSCCVLAAPLIVDHSVIGALIIESPLPNALSKDDQRQVTLLAAQAAIGIRNAQLYKEAQDAINVRDTFLSIASHELKTPLTSMLGNAHLLERRVHRDNSLNERDRRTLHIISKQATRLSRMVTSLLDLSRIQKGQLSIERAPLDLGMLIERVVEETQFSLDRHTVTLTLPDAPLIIEGDELRLEQVLHNLIQNAAKYSPEQDSITVTLEQRADQATVQISDKGIGIPLEAQPQLFSQFFRADNAKTQHIAGLGVGLFVVREIITLHAGRVEVESEEGKGSTFTISIPLARE